MIAIDPDGKDYRLVFEGNTVTVYATYYTNASSRASADQAVATINNQSGNFTYTVGKGESATTYTVNFQLDVVEVPAVSGISEKNAVLSATNADKSGQANAYLVVPNSEFDENTSGSATGNSIKVKESAQDTSTGAHEVGHTLGMIHDTDGLMTPARTDPNRTENLNKTGVKDMISIPLKGKINWDYTSDGKKADAGKGIVVNNTTQTNDELKKGKVK